LFTLLSYPLLEGVPPIRPASAKRGWMDGTTESFAYRCLPLNIANSHGWVLDCACDFTAWWDGSSEVRGVHLTSDAPACREPLRHYGAPFSHFGHGVLTFHVGCLFRTDPRVNLWVSGPPNEYKDGIVALSGIIETDWAPFTFTMNWRFVRPNAVVSFKRAEPVCFFFPLVSRHMMETTQPEFRDLASDPALDEQYRSWQREREAFHHDLTVPGSSAQQAGWQKHYYRGIASDERAAPFGHQSKLRLRPFLDRRRGDAGSAGTGSGQDPVDAAKPRG
jgi:hypothetical protein